MSEVKTLTPKEISQHTYWVREELWFNNLARNLPLIRSCGNAADLENQCAGPCVVVAGGPSLDKFEHLEMLRSYQGHLVVCDKELVPCLERGIIPEYVLSVDGDPIIADFYNSALVEKYASRIPAIFSNQVHPSVANYPGKKYWFVILMDDPRGPMSVSRAIHWMTGKKTMTQAYGNVGAFAWGFAAFLGHSPIMMVGLDFSYGPDVQPMQTTYWKAFLETEKGNVSDALRHYKYVANPFGYKVVIDDIWAGYGEILHMGVGKSRAHTVNCSPYTSFFGEKISCIPLDAALKRFTLQI